MGALVERYREALRQAVNPPLDRSTLAQVRIGFDRLLASAYPPRELAPVVDRDIGTPSKPLPIRLYAGNGSSGPAILFFHGGGFILGSLDSHDGFCRHLAEATRMLVVSVGYALAPECPYPAAVDDGLAAARWLLENHDALNVNPEQIVVMGDSAGGYIATRVAAATPELALQVLLYPSLDFTASTSSHMAFGQGYGLDREAIAFCYECFLRAPQSAAEVSQVLEEAPLRGAPAVVVVAEADPLREEGIHYAERLSTSGRGAVLWDIPDTVHGFAAHPSLFPQARTLLDLLADTLRRMFTDAAVDYAQLRVYPSPDRA